MIKCPTCGSEDFDVYDSDGVGNDEICTTFNACFDCDTSFQVTYKKEKVIVR